MPNRSHDLSSALRLETKALHVEAERSGYILEILKGRASREGYALYIRSLLPVYETLEDKLLTHAAEPGLDLFDWPQLFRAGAIADDLTALSGTGWRATLPVLPAARAYVSRIEEVASAAPVRLLGHAYVRYIGDLSGGRIVKALLSKGLGLEAGMLRFFDFPSIADADAYKQAFRTSLDRAGAMTGAFDAVVDEALRAFHHNIDLSMAVHRSMSPRSQSTGGDT